ncbi:hypothetical protein EGJ27_03745 [Pseudomonas sp. v388]|uniref:hypothetical protein n=1 Tax=Pseudomonas sp. v388 TaxID=2479849 RepID=UPI000F782BEA|nr:hypothetical protein [Pseudomonas sp. v388]RRV10734.1 hypothetical protein EGJ27_03745 [Pseudomonas sp. v388]
MELAGCIAYSKNSVELGRVDQSGHIRHVDELVFRISRGAVYSVHDMYLGQLRNGVGVTDRGELLFTLSPAFA